MAAYATKNDMIARFGIAELIQRTDDVDSGEIGERKLNFALTDASAEIDSYLGRYSLPLSSIPPVLIRIACDVARYYLYDDIMTDEVKERYKLARDYMTSVSKGTVTLGDISNGTSTTADDLNAFDVVEIVSSQSVFGR